MRITNWTLIACMSVLLGGCGSLDTLTRKQAETEGRLEQILQTTVAQKTEISGLTRAILATEKKIAELETVSVSQGKEIEALRIQIATKAKDEQSPPVPSTIAVLNSDAEKPDKESLQQEAYMKAFGMYSSSRYNEAISAFTEFISAYPDGDYAANARYWIGECYYSQNNYQKALEAFNTVLAKYPKANKVPDAMLKAAFSLQGKGDKASARATLQKLIETWPKSPAAIKAKERLNRP